MTEGAMLILRHYDGQKHEPLVGQLGRRTSKIVKNVTSLRLVFHSWHFSVVCSRRGAVLLCGRESVTVPYIPLFLD